ncbi:arylsulfatase G-like isoform X1 [Anneissia japonica]|uniref:arylsulfatase G-like isoform X1 n=1 Tax=Anneissia japonica TaxID=1529436 RepID=UPI001425A591|nr:arylsulfatase G-like isoform X1 [Anneissia japonica]
MKMDAKWLLVFVTIICINYLQTSRALIKDQQSTTSQPNFIILFMDDIGWGDLGANWNPSGNSDTPFMDALAKKGMRFTDFHSGASICTPSRAALLTGRLGKRTGVIRNFGKKSTGGLPLNETTMAETLQAGGYRTGMIGKWHLGMTKPFQPYRRGFEYFYGLPWSNDMGCVDKPGQDIPHCAPCAQDPHGILSNEIWSEGIFKNYSYNKQGSEQLGCDPQLALPLFENDTILHQPVNLQTLSNNYAEKAQAFIKNSKNKTDSRPFLLYIAFAHMHVPLIYMENFTNSSKSRGVYGDTLHELDNTVQRIYKAVQDAGVEENTLIWATGDNGPWEVKCQLSGDPGPFIGGWQKQNGGGSTSKLTVWEGGHREPSFAYWLNHIKPGSVSDSILSAMDIYPTLASLAGIALPSDREYDGIDISGVLLNGEEIKQRVLFHPNSKPADRENNGEFDAIRYNQYKAIYRSGGVKGCGGVKGDIQRHNPPLIFNLLTDPGEEHPLDTQSNEYQDAYTHIKLARMRMDRSIFQDNTTVADYSQSPDAEPCCNPNHVVCRCTL